MSGVIKKLLSKLTQKKGFVAIGYPKVGNTWTRMMLGRYVQQYANLNDMPLFDVGDHSELRRRIGRGAIGHFTHSPLEWANQVANDLNYSNTIVPFLRTKVVLLVRHPLDVVVSHYMHNRYKLGEALRYNGSLIEFIDDPVFGIQKLIKFYSLWRDHRADAAGVFLWRYEDVKAAPAVSLDSLLRFLGMPRDQSAIKEAIAFTSFENMKEMERKGTNLVYRSSGFKVFGPGDRRDPNAFHVRSGTVGGFRDEIPAEVIERVAPAINRVFSEFYKYPEL